MSGTQITTGTVLWWLHHSSRYTTAQGLAAHPSPIIVYRPHLTFVTFYHGPVTATLISTACSSCPYPYPPCPCPSPFPSPSPAPFLSPSPFPAPYPCLPAPFPGLSYPLYPCPCLSCHLSCPGRDPCCAGRGPDCGSCCGCDCAAAPAPAAKHQQCHQRSVPNHVVNTRTHVTLLQQHPQAWRCVDHASVTAA